MSGGTITVTNVGVFGVDAGVPILNPGEAAILAVQNKDHGHALSVLVLIDPNLLPGDMRAKRTVVSVLESLPGVGKVRARHLMSELEISESRRLRGLGTTQRRALLEKFAG